MPIKGSFGAASSRSFKQITKTFKSFYDDFNRNPDYSGSLGVSSSGKLWNVLKGTWYGFGGAVYAYMYNEHYIATVDMEKSDVTASVSIAQGISSVIATDATISAVGAGDGTTGEVGYYWGTISIQSGGTTGVQVGDSLMATDGTGKLYNLTPQSIEVMQVVDAVTLKYRVKGGGAPSPGTITNLKYIRPYDNGVGIAAWTTDSNNWIGIVNGVKATSCNCSMCGNGTYSCTGYGVSSWSCTGGYSATWSCTGYSTYTYPNYGTKTGYYRIVSYSSSTGCNRYGQYTGCNGSSANYSCSSSTQNVSSCNCQTCYPSYIAIVQSVSGAVTELTRYSISSAVKAFKVITNSVSKTFTIKAYSDQSKTTQIGSDITYTNTGLTPTNKFGIVSSLIDGDTVTYNRTAEFDDFQVDIN